MTTSTKAGEPATPETLGSTRPPRGSSGGNERSAWAAISRSPTRFLGSGDPWRALSYAMGSMVLGWVAFFAYAVIVLLPFAPILSSMLARVERGRVRILRLARIADPHPRVDVPVTVRAGTRLAERATWREVAYSLFLAIFGPLASIAIVIVAAFFGATALAPLIVHYGSYSVGSIDIETAAGAWWLVVCAIPILVVLLYLLGVVAAVNAAVARELLGPRDAELATLVATLRSSRGVLVDSFEAERAQIERDLHDGPQQELVGAAMALGELAQRSENLEIRSEIEAAQVRVERALSGLRDTVRGIHPQVLDDFGIEAACAELGAPLPVRVISGTGWHPGRRLNPDVERAMYYTASEAVTNAVKYARATMVIIELAETEGTVTMVVTDDGVGGADAARGSGLSGLVERAAAIDAELVITSPVGGPTELRWTWHNRDAD